MAGDQGAAPAKSGIETGTCYAVESGDRIQIDQGGPAKLRTVCLAGTQAPRMGFKTPSMTTPDAPGAWAAREYLRANMLNKRVQFRVLYERAQGNQTVQFAEVRLEGKNVALEMLQQGLLNFIPSKEVRETIPSSTFSEYQAAHDGAEASRLGLHGGDTMSREITYATDPDFNLDAWFAANKNQKRRAIVDSIRDAGQYKVTFLPHDGDKRYVTANVSLSGIDAPKIRFGEGGVEVETAKGAKDARHWIGMRTMSREMLVHLELMQKGNRGDITLFASILHPAKGSIAEFLLEEGFAPYVGWSGGSSFSGAEKLQASQKKAQLAQKRKWAGYDPNQATADHFEFDGKVTEICSGDVLKIADPSKPIGAKDREVRYYLASVRAPQMPRAGEAAPATSWGPAAVEYFRKKLIGKDCRVRLEYKKNISIFLQQDANAGHPPASDEKTGEMFFVTVFDEKGDNVSVKAVEAGLIKVQLAQGDDNRSCDYAKLLEAEATATLNKAGQFGEKQPPQPPKFQELVLPPGVGAKGSGKGGDAPKKKTGGSTVNTTGKPQSRKELVERAKGFEETLRHKDLTGEVTYMMNGSRMRLKLMEHKLLINFQIEGVKAPNGQRQMGGKGGASANVPPPEPFGNESLQTAREMCMQQNVKVNIERVDPSGTFCGKLFQAKEQGGKWVRKTDIALAMLEQGLAYTDWCHNDEYLAAEKKAKMNKTGLWQSEMEEAATAGAGPFKGEVTQINDLSDFFLVQHGDDKDIQMQISKANIKDWDTVQAEDIRRSKGIFMAKCYGDNTWYRGKFQGSSRGVATMQFPDSGMSAEVEEIKKIPAKHYLATAPPAAIRCGLYGVKGSTQAADWEAAGGMFFRIAGEGVVSGEIICVDNSQGENKHKLVVMAKGANVQEMLLKEGLARLVKDETSPKLVKYADWEKAEAGAIDARKHIWRYGHCADEDEEGMY